METIARRTGWVLMYLLAILLVLSSARYFLPGMPGAFQPDVYMDVAWLIRIHIAAGTVAVLAGPMQFWSGFRNRHRTWHKRIGVTYLLAVAFGAVAGLAMATFSKGGMVTHFGFSLLALTWGGTSLFAYIRIRSGDWQRHREWMIRSYAATLAFVMLRLWLAGLQIIGVPAAEAFQSVAWLCWVPNLIVAELYIGWWRNRGTASTANAA